MQKRAVTLQTGPRYCHESGQDIHVATTPYMLCQVTYANMLLTMITIVYTLGLSSAHQRQMRLICNHDWLLGWPQLAVVCAF